MTVSQIEEGELTCLGLRTATSHVTHVSYFCLCRQPGAKGFKRQVCLSCGFVNTLDRGQICLRTHSWQPNAKHPIEAMGSPEGN